MTKEIAVRPVPFFAGIRCDRCGSSAKQDGEGFGNFVSLDFDCSWGSALGDGTHVDLDLCHRCVQEVLGPWLQLSLSSWNGGPRRIGLMKGRVMQRPTDWTTFFEADLTVSDDFMRAVRDQPPGTT